MIKTTRFNRLLRYGLTASVAFTTYSTMSVTAMAQSRVLFEQILERPNDIPLNLRYAKQQEATGDLLSALSVIERILLENPDNDDIRLQYARLLLQIDDQQGAEREISLLGNRNLTPAQIKQLETFGRKTHSNHRKIVKPRVSGTIAAGLRYDDNAGETLFDGNVPISNSDDFAGVLQGMLQFAAPLSDDGMTFRARVNGQTVRHKKFSNTDYDTYGIDLGVKAGDRKTTWALNFVWNNIQLDNDKYVTWFGPKFSVQHTLNDKVDLLVSGRYLDQKYTKEFLQDQRDGDFYTASAGLKIQPTISTTVNLTAGYENKDADIAPFAYDGWRVDLWTRHNFDNDLYLTGQAYYRDLSYENTRRDERIYARGAFGFPMSRIAQGALDNVIVELGVNYLDRNSNQFGLDHNNLGANARMIWNF